MSVIEKDGPYEVEWTRYGFIWGPVHVERIGIENGAAGFYLTDGQGNGIEVHVPVDGHGPARAFRDWRELRPRRTWRDVFRVFPSSGHDLSNVEIGRKEKGNGR